ASTARAAAPLGSRWPARTGATTPSSPPSTAIAHIDRPNAMLLALGDGLCMIRVACPLTQISMRLVCDPPPSPWSRVPGVSMVPRPNPRLAKELHHDEDGSGGVDRDLRAV